MKSHGFHLSSTRFTKLRTAIDLRLNPPEHPFEHLVQSTADLVVAPLGLHGRKVNSLNLIPMVLQDADLVVCVQAHCVLVDLTLEWV